MVVGRIPASQEKWLAADVCGEGSGGGPGFRRSRRKRTSAEFSRKKKEKKKRTFMRSSEIGQQAKPYADVHGR